jgi:hypothetical protein
VFDEKLGILVDFILQFGSHFISFRFNHRHILPQERIKVNVTLSEGIALAGGSKTALARESKDFSETDDLPPEY